MSKTNKRGQSHGIPRPQKPDPEQKFDSAALAKLLDEWTLGDETEQRCGAGLQPADRVSLGPRGD
jgi:hypothetical protein